MSSPPRARRSRGLVLLAALLLAAPGALAAQNPPARPDTLPRPAPADTVRLEGRDSATFRVPPGALPTDTLPQRGQDTVPADSVGPAPLVPAYPQPDSAGFWNGTWVWDREALGRFHGTSLLDLLATVPGVTVTRGGGWLTPAGVAPWGLGGGRTRFFYDGWEVDPLASATLDLQEVSLTELEEVRVERRLDELRVEVLPFRLPDDRPYSQIELGTGDPQARLLRGLFGAAAGSRQTVTVGFDVADIRLGRNQTASVTSAFARWGFRFGERAGIQAEYRTAAVVREDTAYAEEADRRALWLRGRFAPTPALTFEAMAGRNWRVPSGRDRFPETMESDQAAARALLRGGIGWLEGIARLRRVAEDEAFAAPASDLEARAGLRLPLLEVQGSARAATLAGEAGTEMQGSVRLGPLGGLSAFGSLTSGTRGVPLLRGDTLVAREPVIPRVLRADTLPLFGVAAPTLSGLRAGAEWAPPGAIVGASLVRLDADLAVPYGLRLDDSVARATPVEASTGIEAYVSVPLFFRSLRLDGWYTRWTETGGRPYLPEEQGRAALEFHDVFYTGNLEPTLRLEAVHRGATLFPQPDDNPGDGELPEPLLTERYTLLNFFMQIRVIDVRAFLMVENLLNLRTAFEVPGRRIPAARAVFGIRWHFRN